MASEWSSGRNGAGKTTLMRAAAGVLPVAAGSIGTLGGMALAAQSPADMIVRDRVADELPGRRGTPRWISSASARPASDPRDLSGGERQRLTLALAMAGRTGGALPALVCLDEPTRGMDAARKQGLRDWLAGVAEAGSAVLVATHDVEFAARFADRILLLGEGELLADGPPAQVLAGGWYFGDRGRARSRWSRRDAGGRDRAARPQRRGRGCRWERIMSWQVASFAGLAIVLVVGFAWYERTRPSSRVVALVAALAALAVAGRLVLAPVPNVVGTTDVALLTGYALGGAPGFAVGALAAPISNIWLGQGPWTIWQMAGWGLGLAGAGLATVFGRHVGRLGLACACAAMAFAYGALLDLSVMVTYGGEQSLDRYLALSARGVPFNVAHALGNFATPSRPARRWSR